MKAKGTGKRHWDRTGNLLSEPRASLGQLTHILHLGAEGQVKTCTNKIMAPFQKDPKHPMLVRTSHLLPWTTPAPATDAEHDPKSLSLNVQKALYTADHTQPELCVRLLFIDSGAGEKSKASNDQHNPCLWNLIQTSFITSLLWVIPFIQASIRCKKEIIASSNFQTHFYPV